MGVHLVVERGQIELIGKQVNWLFFLVFAEKFIEFVELFRNHFWLCSKPAESFEGFIIVGMWLIKESLHIDVLFINP